MCKLKEVHVNKFESKVRKDYIFLRGEREVGEATERFRGKDEGINKYILR